MSKMTGDLVELGVGKEATRGTIVAPAYGIRWGEVEVNDRVMESLDEGRLGILEDSRDLKVVGTLAEGTVSGPVRDKFIGLFLLSLFGTNTDSGPADSLYTHTLTVQQNVNHQSLSLHRKDPNGGYQMALAMISSFELSIETDKHAMFSCDFRSKTGSVLPASQGVVTITIASPGVLTLSAHGLATGDAITLATTDTLPTGLVAGTTYYVVAVNANTFSLATTLANALASTKINTSVGQAGVHTLTLVSRYIAYATENIFLPQHAAFKLASTQAGLDGATAIKVRSATLTIESEAEDDRRLGSVAQEDIVNKGFSVSLEVVIPRDAETYITALKAGTAYAARLDMQNTDALVGVSSNPRLYFDLHQVVLESSDTDVSKGDLALQTLVFKATYKETDSAMIKGYLLNGLASIT